MVSAFATLALALHGEPKIDLRITAVRLERLTDTLAKVTGKRIAIAQYMRDEVVLIAVKNVDSEELLSRIAAATSGTWITEKDGTLVLTRPTEVEARQRQAWGDDRYSQLKLAVDGYIKRAIPKTGPWTQTDAATLLSTIKEAAAGGYQDWGKWQARKALHERLIGGRLLARLLANVDLKRVASLLPYDRAVFSTRPTKLQFALGLGAQKALATFSQEQRTLASASKQFERSPIDLTFTSGGTVYYTEPLAAQPAGAGIVVSERGETWELTVFDDEGATLFTSRALLGTLPSPVAALAPELAKLGKTKIALSGAAEAFARSTSGFRDPKTEQWVVTEAKGETRKALVHPEDVDPLRFCGSEGLLQVADALGTNYVGCVPDSLIMRCATIGDLARKARLSVNGGWLESAPSDFQARLEHFPRTVLGSFAREVDRAGIPTLTCQFILARVGIGFEEINTPDPLFWIANYWARGLGGPLMLAAGKVSAAVLIDGLTREQQDWLLAGNALLYRELAPATRSRFEDLLFHRAGHRLTELLASPRGAMRLNGWISEPTTGWVGGIPGDAKLTIKATETPFAIDLDTSPHMLLAPEILAFDLNQLANGATSETGFAKTHRLIPGVSNRYAITLQSGPLRWDSSLAGHEIDREAEPKRLDQFPKEFLDLIEEAKRRMGIGGFNASPVR